MKYSEQIKPISYVKSYEAMQETIAMLQIVAMSERAVAEGRVKPAEEVFRRLHEKIKQ
jgi:hypothetical protein